jgi:hypothetical protein
LIRGCYPRISLCSIQANRDGLGTRNTMCYGSTMVRTLEKAIAEVSNLPDADQEQIGQQLLSHVEKLRRLRAEIDKGIRSLDAGEGNPLDVEDFLR